MKILVDARISHNQSHLLTLVETWVKEWGEYYPQYEISILLFRGVTLGFGTQELYVSANPYFLENMNLKKNLKKIGFDVVLSFSLFDPILANIPTISHIYDLSSILYPKRQERSFLGRKKHEQTLQNIVKNSKHLICPFQSIGMELVEMFDTPEENIDIIPYLTPHNTTVPHVFSPIGKYNITNQYFLFDSSYGNESSIIRMIDEYKKYRSLSAHPYDLVMLGNPQEELSSLSLHIRNLDLVNWVRVLGTIAREDHELIYQNASGWIWSGLYYAGENRIIDAIRYRKPLLLSEVPSLKEFKSALTIHPNHLSDLPEKILALETHTDTDTPTENNRIIGGYYHVLSENFLTGKSLQTE